MKLLILSQYFWPENFRINDVAEGLASRGHSVTVYTALPNYPAGKFFPGYGFAGPYRENGWIEDYVAEVRGEPIACVVLISRNAAGETQRVAANYRPLETLLLFSRALRERFAGTPVAEHFAE